MSTSFTALTGYYRILFLYLEPISVFLPAILAWSWPGPTWFYSELIPGSSSSATFEANSRMAVWHLSNCYFLLGLISSLVFRAVRDTLPNNAVAQERIIGAALTALAIADLTHVAATMLALPYTVMLTPRSWNPMTHGNITITLFLFISRMAWFSGIGRERCWYGVKQKSA